MKNFKIRILCICIGKNAFIWKYPQIMMMLILGKIDFAKQDAKYDVPHVFSW